MGHRRRPQNEEVHEIDEFVPLRICNGTFDGADVGIFVCSLSFHEYKAENVSRTTERSPPTSPNMPVVSRFRPLQQQQTTGSGDRPELPARRLSGTASNLTFHLLEGTGTMSAATPRPKSSPAVVECNSLDTGPAPAIPVLWSHQLVKPAVSYYWNISAFRLMIRAGPVIKLRSDRFQKAQSEKYQQVGSSLILSIYLPPHFRQILGLALCNFEIMVTNRTRYTLHWSLGFPKLVSAHAEIFKSARAGLTGNVKNLLILGLASAKDTTLFGTTLLHSASKSGNMELVRLLIREGADVNAQDEDGESPLHGAMARSDNYNVARTLIENGADLSSKAVDGKTPFHNIFNNTISHVLMRDDCLENMLPDSEAMSITHFLAWSSKSTPEIFQRGHLYDHADLFSADNLGRTCLHFAASRGNVGVLSYLLRRVSSEGLEQKDIQGRTPFHYAAESSRAAEVIDMLVGRGCNIHAVDDRGRTALHWAARWNDFKAVKKLIAIGEGGTLILSDKYGRMPSREVCQRRVPALYRYLRDLESLSGLSTKHSNTTRVRRGWASHGADSDFLLVPKIIGVLALILMMLLGAPD